MRTTTDDRWAWLRWAVRIVPTRAGGGGQARHEHHSDLADVTDEPDATDGRVGATLSKVPLAPLRRPASTLARVLPPVLAVIGLTLALLSAIAVERWDVDDGPTTLALELGAALWFGGAVAWSLRATTVRRALLIVATGVTGTALVAVALAAGWSGTALDLAMEFGVGAVAIVVIDVVVLGALHTRLDALGHRADRTAVDVHLTWGWPPVRFRIARGGR